MIGEMRIKEFTHPDGGMTVWSVQQLRKADGRYAKPGDTWWKNMDPRGEPFTSKEEAQQHLEACLSNREQEDA